VEYAKPIIAGIAVGLFVLGVIVGFLIRGVVGLAFGEDRIVPTDPMPRKPERDPAAVGPLIGVASVPDDTPPARPGRHSLEDRPTTDLKHMMRPYIGEPPVVRPPTPH
jgi:hypothetical protein